jgi:exosortase family protein XrtF
MSWKENGPALKFLGLFLGVYGVGNLLYGFYIEYNYPGVDQITQWVSSQSSWLIYQIGDVEIMSVVSATRPITMVVENEKTILNIYEGCNGVNVMIVFVAFVLAFGGASSRGALFMVAGLGIIHVANLIRIALLFWVARYYETWFYYVHKYIFTAALYVIVLLLWWVWVTKTMKIDDRAKKQA